MKENRFGQSGGKKKSRFQIEILLEIQVKTFEKEKKQVDIPVQNSGETWIELEI